MNIETIVDIIELQLRKSIYVVANPHREYGYRKSAIEIVEKLKSAGFLFFTETKNSSQSSQEDTSNSSNAM